MLSDPQKRTIYDQYGEEGLKGGSTPPNSGGAGGPFPAGMGGMGPGASFSYQGVDQATAERIFQTFFGGDRSGGLGGMFGGSRGGMFGGGGPPTMFSTMFGGGGGDNDMFGGMASGAGLGKRAAGGQSSRPEHNEVALSLSLEVRSGTQGCWQPSGMCPLVFLSVQPS